MKEVWRRFEGGLLELSGRDCLADWQLSAGLQRWGSLVGTGDIALTTDTAYTADTADTADTNVVY